MSLKVNLLNRLKTPRLEPEVLESEVLIQIVQRLLAFRGCIATRRLVVGLALEQFQLGISNSEFSNRISNRF